jgi:6-phosphofructokinase
MRLPQFDAWSPLSPTGGHNVIAGLLDFLSQRHPGSHLYGFLDGPKGILKQRCAEITAESMVSTWHWQAFGTGHQSPILESRLVHH